MQRFAFIAVAVAVLALAGGFLYVSLAPQGDDRFASCRTGVVAGGSGQIGGPFELVNAESETVTEADVITEPSLLYFGYTFCPDVCPLDVARNAEAVDLLTEQGLETTPVFISIDPGRDTPDVVGDFAANMHEDMIGLTGSEAQVRAASQAFRTYYKAQPADDEYYLVDHSTFTYLVLPEEGFVEFFRRDLTPRQMADQVACFVEKA